MRCASLVKYPMWTEPWIVIDDVIPFEQQITSLDRVLRTPVDWRFSWNQAYQWGPLSPNFSCTTIWEGQSQHELANLTQTLFTEFCRSQGIRARSHRQRIALTQPQLDTRIYPHVDSPEPHWVAIYYMDDSDGDTVLYSQRVTDIPWGDPVSADTLTEMARIQPRRGRWLVFNGSYYHAATAPQHHQLRLIINYCFTLI